jgi:hypothetical protein
MHGVARIYRLSGSPLSECRSPKPDDLTGDIAALDNLSSGVLHTGFAFLEHLHKYHGYQMRHFESVRIAFLSMGQVRQS